NRSGLQCRQAAWSRQWTLASSTSSTGRSSVKATRPPQSRMKGRGSTPRVLPEAEPCPLRELPKPDFFVFMASLRVPRFGHSDRGCLGWELLDVGLVHRLPHVAVLGVRRLASEVLLQGVQAHVPAGAVASAL